MPYLKILFTGYRKAVADADIFMEALFKEIDQSLPSYTFTVLCIEGGATGIDQIVANTTKLYNRFQDVRVYAKWDQLGKAAGPIRNAAMLALEPHFVIAIHYDLKNSKGTKRCMAQAKSKKIPVIYFDYTKGFLTQGKSIEQLRATLAKQVDLFSQSKQPKRRRVSTSVPKLQEAGT